MHEDFYNQKVHEKLESLDYRGIDAIRDKHGKIKTTLRFQLNGRNRDFLKLITKIEHKIACDWVKKFQLIKIGQSEVIACKQHENKKK